MVKQEKRALVLAKEKEVKDAGLTGREARKEVRRLVQAYLKTTNRRTCKCHGSQHGRI